MSKADDIVRDELPPADPSTTTTDALAALGQVSKVLRAEERRRVELEEKTGLPPRTPLISPADSRRGSGISSPSRPTTSGEYIDSPRSAASVASSRLSMSVAVSAGLSEMRWWQQRQQSRRREGTEHVTTSLPSPLTSVRSALSGALIADRPGESHDAAIKATVQLPITSLASTSTEEPSVKTSEVTEEARLKEELEGMLRREKEHSAVINQLRAELANTRPSTLASCIAYPSSVSCSSCSSSSSSASSPSFTTSSSPPSFSPSVLLPFVFVSSSLPSPSFPSSAHPRLISAALLLRELPLLLLLLPLLVSLLFSRAYLRLVGFTTPSSPVPVLSFRLPSRPTWHRSRHEKAADAERRGERKARLSIKMEATK